MHKYVDAGGEVISQQQAHIRKETPIHIGVAKLDYKQALGENVRWEVGLKSTGSRFRNDVKFGLQQEEGLLINPSLTQKHRLKEDVFADYTSLYVQLD